MLRTLIISDFLPPKTKSELKEMRSDSLISVSSNLPDVRAIGYIAMELMQKYVKDDGAVKVEDLECWPSDSNAIDFLSRTISALSVDELLKVRRMYLSKL
jgi:hypothetical protein